MNRTDEELVAAAAAGEDTAFEELTARYLREVYSFALRLVGVKEEAEDISQETFVKVWKNLKKYNQKSSKFKTWLMRIARNTCVDHLRKQKSVPFSQFEGEEGENVLIEGLQSEEPLADELVALSQDAAMLERGLEQLSPAHREVLLLRYQEGLSFAEVSGIIGASQNTVKSRHRRALHQLGAILRIYRHEAS
jgi:RNA polymerase sigma-70 factor (ECF subfamily)